jgi:hypothetical protein
MLFPPPHNKVSHFSPGLSYFHLLFYYFSFYISLSLLFKLNIFGGHSIGHSKAKSCICTCVLFRTVSEIELFHCNSVTVQNRTHVYMDFFDHKDLGNHLLQLCPKVMKHPVCICDILNIYIMFVCYMFRPHEAIFWQNIIKESTALCTFSIVRLMCVIIIHFSLIRCFFFLCGRSVPHWVCRFLGRVYLALILCSLL